MVFLAFYRSGFLHSLLPFEEAMFWVRNAVFAVTLGICSARFPMAQRRGKRFTELIVLACGVLGLFSRETGHRHGGLCGGAGRRSAWLFDPGPVHGRLYPIHYAYHHQGSKSVYCPGSEYCCRSRGYDPLTIRWAEEA